MSCYELGEYPNSGLFFVYYLKFLKLKLEKILHPGIHDQLKKDYDQGQKIRLKISENIGMGAELLFDKILKSKDDVEFKHLPLLQ